MPPPSDRGGITNFLKAHQNKDTHQPNKKSRSKETGHSKLVHGILTLTQNFANIISWD